jgi:hypothetical protein
MVIPTMHDSAWHRGCIPSRFYIARAALEGSPVLVTFEHVVGYVEVFQIGKRSAEPLKLSYPRALSCSGDCTEPQI